MVWVVWFETQIEGAALLSSTRSTDDEEHGLADTHGLSDVNWAAVAFGLADDRKVERLWPRMLGEPAFRGGDMYAHLAPGHLHKAVEVLNRGKTQLAPEVAPRTKAGIGRTRKLLKGMVGLEGIEPPTNGLGNRCSILLSYRPVRTY